MKLTIGILDEIKALLFFFSFFCGWGGGGGWSFSYFKSCSIPYRTYADDSRVVLVLLANRVLISKLGKRLVFFLRAVHSGFVFAVLNLSCVLHM